VIEKARQIKMSFSEKRKRTRSFTLSCASTAGFLFLPEKFGRNPVTEKEEAKKN